MCVYRSEDCCCCVFAGDSRLSVLVFLRRHKKLIVDCRVFCWRRFLRSDHFKIYDGVGKLDFRFSGIACLSIDSRSVVVDSTFCFLSLVYVVVDSNCRCWSARVNSVIADSTFSHFGGCWRILFLDFEICVLLEWA